MGTAWDVANAALFLHSDEAQFHQRNLATRRRSRMGKPRQVLA